ncbi:MAG: EAL domain-containing protein, partial [Litoreibacter sp.]|nr:EAL domain-containing protein [Litoreibacter sp.]
AEQLVRSIIEMSHSLNVPVIAEGTEDLDVIGRLEELNCDFVQGFALAKPMDIEGLTDFLREQQQSQTQVKSLKTGS